jgi:salicylate biosynthesis isochorismate synthase
VSQPEASRKPRYVARSQPLRVGALLRLGPEPLSLCWSHPNAGQWACGLGVAGERTGDLEWLGPPPVVPPPGPFFGGWAFDSERAWSGYESERWFLPEVLGWWDGRRAVVAAFGPEGTSAAELDARLRAVCEVDALPGPLCARRVVDANERRSWTALVEAALEEIEAGRAQKLVAARAIRVESASPIQERLVLKALEARSPSCRVFLLRGGDGSAFIGASPELLCEARDGMFFAEALAGTGAPGAEAALLASTKERHEHQLVVDGIRERLQPFAYELEPSPKPGPRPLPNLVHLHTPIRATLKPGTDVLAVARALHPTPAVSGTPRAEAVRWLRAREGFSRGWYAGAVGALGPQGITLAVGLRCARVSGRFAELYVGAGVVQGSTANGEWLETERKAQSFLDALGVSDG